MSDRPLARIRLPSHHPIVQALKNGGKVMLHAVANDTEENVKTAMEMKPNGPRPMPLERTFHVTKIEPPNVGREPSEDVRDAVKFLKKRQTGGRSVS